MGRWIADRVHEARGGRSGSVLALGLTFKENVPDLRNSRAIDVIERLVELGHDVEVADPLADADAVREEYGLGLSIVDGRAYDLVIGLVGHEEYRALDGSRLAAPGGMLADPKGLWRGVAVDGVARWTL